MIKHCLHVSVWMYQSLSAGLGWSRYNRRNLPAVVIRRCFALCGYSDNYHWWVNILHFRSSVVVPTDGTQRWRTFSPLGDFSRFFVLVLKTLCGVLSPLCLCKLSSDVYICPKWDFCRLKYVRLRLQTTLQRHPKIESEAVKEGRSSLQRVACHCDQSSGDALSKSSVLNRKIRFERRNFNLIGLLFLLIPAH